VQFPIVEIKDRNLFILDQFQGFESGSEITIPFNRFRNLTRYIIDSSGSVYELTHTGHNNQGLRKVISSLWNISRDTYSFKLYKDKDVNWFLDILKDISTIESEDLKKLRAILVVDLEKMNGNEVLESAVKGLNL